MLAIEVWGDAQALGPEVALALGRVRLTELERGDLIVKLRVLSWVAAEHRKAKMEEAKRKGAPA